MLSGKLDEFTTRLSFMVFPVLCRLGIFLVLTFALLTHSGWSQRIGPLVLEKQQRSKAAAVRPPSLQLSLPSPATAVLPPPGPDDLQRVQPQQGQPPLIGVHRQLPPGVVKLSLSGETVMTTATGAWQSTASVRLWRLRVTSLSARAMRIHFQDFAIGAGSLWLHSASGQIVGPYRGSGLYGNGDFWSGIVFGDSLTIEYLPHEEAATEAVPFQIVAISHIWDDAFGADMESASESPDRRESEKLLLAGPIEVAVGTQSKPSWLDKSIQSVKRSTSLQSPRPKAARRLTPGRPVEFRRGPVDSPTLFTGDDSYRLEVPDNASRVTLTLESVEPDVDVDLYVRYGEDNDVQNGRPVTDYASEGLTGNEEIVITPESDPPLRAGTYFVSVSLYDTGVVAECTLTAEVERDGEDPEPISGGPLTPGQPADFRLGPVDTSILFNGRYSYRLEVPEEPSRVTLTLESADADVDVGLYARFGEDNELQDGRFVYDYGSRGGTGNEEIVITPESDPPLRAGTYFVSLVLWDTGVVAEGTLTAEVERDGEDPGPISGGPLTPGRPADFRLGPVDSPTLFNRGHSFRLEVPEDASRVTFTLESADPDVDVALAVRYGEDNNVQDGRLASDYASKERIGITRRSDPPLRAGTYFVTVVLLDTGVVAEGTITATVETDAADCHLDVTCHSEWSSSATGVARIFFETSEGGSAVCSGTVLNNSRQDFTPYFLTAAHCVQTEEEARSVIAVWFYQTRTCNGEPPDLRSVPRTEGARLLATTGHSEIGQPNGDMTLLRLEGDLPDGVMFQGWDADPQPVGKQVTGIHHPGSDDWGQFKRISFGQIISGPRFETSDDVYAIVRYTQGVVEEGSSGSALFSKPETVVGVQSFAPQKKVYDCSSGPFFSGATHFSVFYPQIRQFIDEEFALEFAHFANASSITSDVVLLNVATKPIGPILYFYDQEGDRIGAESVVEITADLEVLEDGALKVRTEIAPLGELTISTRGRGELVTGSVRVVSDGPIGGVLRFDIRDLGVAGVGASEPVNDALFPARRQTRGINTGVALRNMETEEMTVSCYLMRGGSVLDEADIQLVADGQAARFINEIFPGTNTSDFVGSVRCIAPDERRFTGIALELDSSNGIFTTLPVVPVDQKGGGNRETTLEFAHFANGSSIISDVVLVNVAPHRTRPALYFYDREGDQIDPESVVEITRDLRVAEDGALTVLTQLPPLAEFTISTHGRGELVTGSVRVVSDGPIGGVLRFDIRDLGVAGVGASEPVNDALFPARRQAGGINTGVALRNMETEEMTVSCYLMRGGSVLDEADIQLAANGQTTHFIDEIFDHANAVNFVGSVRCIASDEGRFAGIALELDFNNGIFTTLPVVPVIDDDEIKPDLDLIVESAAVSDASVESGATFTLMATVRNRGPIESVATTLRYYRSTDTMISAGDTEVGTDSVGFLRASETSDESIRLTAPSSPGRYYYGACVDTVPDESDTANNCSSAVAVTVGAAPAPDLVVESPTVSERSPAAGQTFRLSATVRNQGAGDATSSTYLHYYRSADVTIGTSDTEVGSRDYVGYLDASETSEESIRLTAPSNPGRYYYGACVDTVPDESDTANNCSSAVAVTVGAAPAPDLVVESPTVSERSPAAGQTFTLSATVRNQGAGDATSSTYLHYYRSADATIGTSDTEVGSRDYVGYLDASETSEESIRLTAPSNPGRYYYGACVDTVPDESDTANNCSSAVAVTVGAAPAPDLVVESPTVSERSPAAGQTFRLSATVRNQGAGDATSSTYLHYYRSADATIGTSDTEVGTRDYVGYLDASGTSEESIRLTAPSNPGRYYYGACVDTVPDESDTANNCSSAVAVTVGAAPAPDLVVESPTVSERSPAAGQTFRLSATVRNQGAGDATSSTYLHYYRSADATIGTSDTEVGTRDYVGYLDASGTSEESIRLTAPSNPGRYYYGACVDTVPDESDTANNCSSAVAVTVGAASAPDLVVESPTVSDSSPEAADSFDLSATVRNQGAGSSSSFTTLRYYRSTDATISAFDTEVGTDSVGILAASGTSNESIRMTAPSNPGRYYYGACVDTVPDESDTANNCSSAVEITVGTAPAPDLVVESPTVSDSSPEAADSFDLSATVRNQGAGSSSSSLLRYYRSTDATISAGDTAVGTDFVGILAASGTSNESIRMTAPSSAGRYYYGACVDAVSDESDTGNNCSSGVEVTVGAAPAPDLVVESPTVSNSSPAAGQSFTLSATVRNQGAGDATSSVYLHYYRSADVTIGTSDTEVGTRDFVGILAASGTSDESTRMTAPSSAGTYYYGACVDTVSDESDTANNCSSAVEVIVGAAPAPDLVVESPTVSDSSPTAGNSFELSATVRNQGTGRSSSFTTLRYYRSTDATISAIDTEVGTGSVGFLAASETSNESIRLTAPSSAGTYYYGACVDTVPDETDTGNNCSSGVEVTVGAPDLVVESPTVSDSSPTAGNSFELSATVRNQGAGRSSSTTLRYYRSTNATISAFDTEVGTDFVGILDASGTSNESINLSAPSSAGTYYYGACVDGVSHESDTGNNCSSGVEVTVGAAPAPDLVVESPTVSDSSPAAGSSFDLSATVRNQGTGRSSSLTTLRYYRSTNATISAFDTEVGTDFVGILDASGTSNESINLSAPSSAGTYYYGACIDTVPDETDTGNNCSSAVEVTVGAPDLVVESPTVSDSSPAVGQSFTFSVTVRNQGTASSQSSVLRYYRSTGATISAFDSEVGTDFVGILGASGISNESINLTAPSSAGTYYYEACVDTVSGESDTGNNCSSWVEVTVGAPDLVVESPTVSDSSPVVGNSFDLSATVRNQGTGSSASITTLRYYRSLDATISAYDTEVGTDFVGILDASGTSNESIRLTAPSTVGTYYYGACVDTVTDESDTANNCSSAVEVTVGAPDLVVEFFDMSDDPPAADLSVYLSATVRNQGTGRSSSTTLRYYRSTDWTISAGDTLVGTDSVGILDASETSFEWIRTTLPSSPGRYTYGACVDPVPGESNTVNNCSNTMTVAK